MRWLKKLRKAVEGKERSAREGYIHRKYGKGGLASQCMECKWFVYRKEKPENWVCRCPDEKLRFVGNTCLGWEYGAHPEMVVMHSR